MTQVVLHHDDADGFGAAFAIWHHDRRHNRPQDRVYIPVNYGEELHVFPPDTTSVVIVDFSYDRETCDALAARYPHFLVIDHHKTAQAALEGATYAHFDMTKSGAVLAWEVFNPNLPVPEILAYVQDRDLWQWKLPYSEEVNLAIHILDRDFDAWDRFDLASAMNNGVAIKKYKDQLVKDIIERTGYVTPMGDHLVACANTPVLVSEVGNALCNNHPAADYALVNCNDATHITCSLRSVGDFDVSTIAKQHGGGGHKNAAGFKLEQ